MQVYFLLLSMLASAYAHTYFSSIQVDGDVYPEGTCVRSHPVGTANSPIPTVYAADMTCGWLPNAAQPTAQKCPVNPGSRVGIQWHYANDQPGDLILDHSHHGPTLVYMAKSDTGAGNVWFKVFESGLVDASANPQVWATDQMIDGGGVLWFDVPTDISPGNYLVRGEIIALHGAYAVNGAQPYVGCAEVTVSGGGTVDPAGVSFPGAYSNQDPGILINIYNGLTSYVIPGPPVYTSGSAPSSSSGSNPNPPPVAPTSAPVPPSGPTAGFNVYSNGVLNSLVADYSWASVKNPMDSTYSFTGTYSYSFVPQNWEAIFLYCLNCFDTDKFDGIEFYVNGGAVGGQQVNFNLIEGGGAVGNSYSLATATGASVPPNAWVKGTVSFSNFASGQYDGIWFQATTTDAQATLYIDGITLVPRSATKDADAPQGQVGTASDEKVAPPSGTEGHKTSTLVVSNLVTGLGTLFVVSLVVLSVYLYQRRKNVNEYRYNQFVENGKL